MKTIRKSQYNYLKLLQKYHPNRQETIEISDEEYDELMLLKNLNKYTDTNEYYITGINKYIYKNGFLIYQQQENLGKEIILYGKLLLYNDEINQNEKRGFVIRFSNDYKCSWYTYNSEDNDEYINNVSRNYVIQNLNSWISSYKIIDNRIIITGEVSDEPQISPQIDIWCQNNITNFNQIENELTNGINMFLCSPLLLTHNAFISSQYHLYNTINYNTNNPSFNNDNFVKFNIYEK